MIWLHPFLEGLGTRDKLKRLQLVEPDPFPNRHALYPEQVQILHDALFTLRELRIGGHWGAPERLYIDSEWVLPPSVCASSQTTCV
jgi:hypothetical protein